jgi:hypothetical protein
VFELDGQEKFEKESSIVGELFIISSQRFEDGNISSLILHVQALLSDFMCG